MSSSEAKGVKSPLQMVGFYLAWVESAMGAGLWAIKDVDSWPRTLLIVAMVLIGLSYAGVVAYVVVYLALKHPHLLFNPSDYAPGVQPLLFDPRPQLDVNLPPEMLEPPPREG